MTIYTDFDQVPLFKYKGIMLDPAWRYVMRSDKGYGKAPQAHYECMSLDEMKALPVANVCTDEAIMFMWTTFPFIPAALELMNALGFEYITGGSWHKKTKYGKNAFGPGYRLRSSSEPFLIGKLNNPSSPDRSIRNTIETCEIEYGNVIEALRREHSRKPEEQYEIMERLVPDGFCLEMFARNEREGWDSWGNEVGKYEEVKKAVAQ